MTTRLGYWKFNRQALDQIAREHGAVAEQTFIRLIDIARIEDGFLSIGDQEIAVRRGMALFSVRSFAERLERSASAIHRAYRKLVDARELELVVLGRSLKRGRGTAPSVVKIMKYEAFSFTRADARYHFETRSETLERMNTGEASSREESKGESSRDEQIVQDQIGSVLGWYSDHVTDARDREAAFDAIAMALTKYSSTDLIAAGAEYLERCGGAVDPTKIPPELFYGWNLHERYRSCYRGLACVP